MTTLVEFLLARLMEEVVDVYGSPSFIRRVLAEGGVTA